MKKIVSALFALMLCVVLSTSAVTVHAAGTLLFDQADLLTEPQEAAVIAKLQSVSQAYNTEIVVATVSSTGDAPVESFANNFYDTNGIGYEPDHDGVLLLISMEERDYYILSNGPVSGNAIADYEIESIGETIVSDLSDGDYEAAFLAFADDCAYYIDGFINGFPFDFGFNLLIALVIGIVISLIVTGIMRSKLKSVRPKNQASDYVKSGSMNVSLANDFFLYRNVTRTKKAESSSSRSGGGSARHGGGGKF